jgi:hypothetical protein
VLGSNRFVKLERLQRRLRFGREKLAADLVAGKAVAIKQQHIPAKIR